MANRYTRLFHTDTDDWLRHWHRCPGCRARTTLPLPHLAAWTAHTACRSLRPTHRASRGRTPCGVLRVSWTGSQNAPRSCLLTVAVDCCPSGEHRVLARVPYREAVERFRVWLAETAPAVAAAAGPDRLDGLPGQSSRTPAARAWNCSERAPGDLTPRRHPAATGQGHSVGHEVAPVGYGGSRPGP
ncbi:hypothetical protein ACFVZA_10855 [Streptomyces bottropensis]|uniref:hypothetical protein n=1 Tax=Streptomyces TaxID=1883 RepID=UPI002FF3812E